MLGWQPSKRGNLGVLNCGRFHPEERRSPQEQHTAGLGRWAAAPHPRRTERRGSGCFPSGAGKPRSARAVPPHLCPALPRAGHGAPGASPPRRPRPATCSSRGPRPPPADISRGGAGRRPGQRDGGAAGYGGRGRLGAARGSAAAACGGSPAPVRPGPVGQPRNGAEGGRDGKATPDLRATTRLFTLTFRRLLGLK